MKRGLTGHCVPIPSWLGWSNLENGDLLREAEGRFEVFVTTDQNLRYQQNLGGRQLAILVLPTTNWPEIQRHQSEQSLATKPKHLLAPILVSGHQPRAPCASGRP